MSFTFRKMTKANADAIVGWRYCTPYDYYNPDPSHTQENIRRFLIPDNPYYSIHDGVPEPVGFCCFGPEGQVEGGDYGENALDIGLGLRPDLTGLGRGKSFLSAILGFADRTFSPAAFRVTVAEFNGRAIRLYRNTGFETTGRFQSRLDGRAFIQMTVNLNVA